MRILLLSAALIIFNPVQGQAIDESGVKLKGVVHNIAEDRLVERVGGRYEPEGLDKYMQRKFERLTAELESVSVKVDAMSRDIKEMKSMIEGMKQA